MALELSKNRTVNILVFSAIIGVLLSVVLLWYSTDQKSRINGASLLAASDKYGVIFSMDKSFYHTDADARVINIVTYEQLGLKKPLADIAFGQDGLYVIEAGEHVVKKCTIPLGQCEQIGIVPGSRSAIAMDIAVTPDNKYFYVSNSSLHRVDKFAIDGTYQYRLDVGESFNYPNDIVAIDTTTIAVADSVNHRVIAINDKGSDKSHIVWQLNVKDLISPLGLDWPSALHFSSNGRLWVNNQNYYFNIGEIAVYDAVGFSFLEHKEYSGGEKVIVDYTREIVPFNDGAEPRNFASLGHKILLGNFSPIELVAIDEDSLGVSSFVDGMLQNEFMTLSANRQYWSHSELLSKYGIGFFVIILLYAAFLEMKGVKKRKEEENASRSRHSPEIGTKLDRYLIEPDGNGIVWLEIKGKNIANMKMMMWGLLFSFPLLMGLMIYSGQDDMTLYLTWGGVLGITIIFAYYFVTLHKNVRLGRDEENIYLANWRGKRAHAPFKEAIFTGNRIVIEDVAVMVVDGKGNEFYDKREYKTYIKPLIGLMQEKSEMEFMLDNLKKGDLKTWLALLIGVPLTIAIVYVGIMHH